jgi:glycosyltransferase involved in cell wall biosynthesis
MRILIVLSYFQPHKSGLTVYAVRQARALVARGHDVTVLTSQYERTLPRDENDQGVRIVRLPVAFRLSKGVIMPTMPMMAWRLIGKSDVVNLHVPQVDAALVAFLAKLQNKPVVLTYHCDLRMPAGLINKIAGLVAYGANRISASLADVVVHNTQDFAEHSAFLKQYIDKLVVIQPPIVVDQVSKNNLQEFYEKYHIKIHHRVVGMVARLATEKGVEYLVQAMPRVIQSMPDARVIFVGEYQHVFGEEAYQEELLPIIKALGDHWTFLGVVSELEKAVFYHLCDVLVLPSINSTESFGMVQIEAMICGTPVVATDLPGVRQPVQSTEMGMIVPVKDSDALAGAILQVLESGLRVDSTNKQALVKHYAPETIAEAYETVFNNLIGDNG